MHEIVRRSPGMPQDLRQIENCYLNNLDAPVVRVGGEPFKSFYSRECCDYGYHVVDPSRSIAAEVIRCLNDENDATSHWPASDVIGTLMLDLGFVGAEATRADLLAFAIMFPIGTGEFLADSYLRWERYRAKPGDALLVLNNPFFYRSPNVSDKRLVEVAEVSGHRYALDRACSLPSPDVIANELALLNYGYATPERVAAVASDLVDSISAAMSGTGLIEGNSPLISGIRKGYDTRPSGNCRAGHPAPVRPVAVSW